DDWSGDGGRDWFSDDYSDERGQDGGSDDHGDTHPRKLGDGDAVVRQSAYRQDAPAHRDDQGLGRQHAEWPGGHVVEQRDGGRDRVRGRTGNGGGGGVGDDHRHERGQEWRRGDYGIIGAGRDGDGGSSCQDAARRYDGAAQCGDQGLGGQHADGPSGRVVEQCPGGGDGLGEWSRDRGLGRVGDDYGDE